MKTRGSPPAGAPAHAPDAARPTPARPLDDRELQRFLRPQPPLPVPERTRPQPPAGYLAHTLLGNRVYKGPR